MRASDVLDAARAEVGVAESPAGSNRVKYNTWYYGREVSGKPYPWCMAFVQWVFHTAHAGSLLPVRTASCGALQRAARKCGRWVTEGFRPGDVVLYDFTGKKRTVQHCGIVKEVRDGVLTAYEGNTGAGNDANGGQVQERRRALGLVVGAYRPAYEEEPMSGEEIYQALNEYLSGQSIPESCLAEYKEAVALGLTDGSDPCRLVPRWQAALMAKRAAEHSAR